MLIISDNMPFNSEPCHQFTKERGFQCQYTSPGNARSNGMAERHIQTVKNVLKKEDEEKTDKCLALLSLRNTPISGLDASLAQVLFSRRLRDLRE